MSVTARVPELLSSGLRRGCRLLRVFLVPVLLVLAGCADAPRPQQARPVAPVMDIRADGAGAPAETTRVTPSVADYLVSVGDVLAVNFPRRPEFSMETMVRPDGMISLPELHSVVAAGRTLQELQVDIASRYAAIENAAPLPESKAYLIQIGDELEIKFPYMPNFTDTVTVRPDGRISLGLVGTLIAEGRTPEALEAELVQRYGEHLVEPSLTVIVRGFTTTQFVHAGRVMTPPPKLLSDVYVVLRQHPVPKIYVAGEVAVPGERAYTGPVTAMQAIIAAGGQKLSAEMRNVLILRKGSNERPMYIVRNLRSDLDGAGTNDIALRPFDVVVVPKSSIASVQDFMDQYVYNLVPTLRNSSVGFQFIREIGPTSN